jgi:hypothetical protein
MTIIYFIKVNHLEVLRNNFLAFEAILPHVVLISPVVSLKTF